VADFKTEHLETAPPWLRDAVSDTLHRAQGDGKDSLVQRLRGGLKARFPLVGPEDALPVIGAERQVERGPAEPASAYAARLVIAWDTWEFGGTPWGILNALWEMGHRTPVLITQAGSVHALNADRELVTTNIPGGYHAFTPDFFNAFELYFPLPLPDAWSGGVPLSASSEANGVRRIVNRWKPAHARFGRVRIQLTGHIWGQPGLEWDEEGETWGGTQKVWGPDNVGLWNEDPAQTWATAGLTWGGPSLY
jgi:hypothetical protein